MKILTVIAVIKAKVGMELQMQKDLESLLAPTLAESGCLTFDLLANREDPNVFVLYENWENQAALDAHFQMPYVQRVLKSYEVTLAEPIQIMFLHKVESVQVTQPEAGKII